MTTTLIVFPSDDVAQILLVAPSEPFTVSFDFTAVLAAGDTVASSTWTTGDQFLSITPAAPAGAIATASFVNTMPEGHSALVHVQIVSAAGATVARSFRSVAVWR